MQNHKFPSCERAAGLVLLTTVCYREAFFPPASPSCGFYCSDFSFVIFGSVFLWALFEFFSLLLGLFELFWLLWLLSALVEQFLCRFILVFLSSCLILLHPCRITEPRFDHSLFFRSEVEDDGKWAAAAPGTFPRTKDPRVNFPPSAQRKSFYFWLNFWTVELDLTIEGFTFGFKVWSCQWLLSVVCFYHPQKLPSLTTSRETKSQWTQAN